MNEDFTVRNLIKGSLVIGIPLISSLLILCIIIILMD